MIDVVALSALLERDGRFAARRLEMVGATISAVLAAGVGAALTTRLAAVGAVIAQVPMSHLANVSQAARRAALCNTARGLTAEDVAPKAYVPEHLAIPPRIAAPTNPLTPNDRWMTSIS